MKNFEVLLSNPELAKYIRIEITGEDLLELSATLIRVGKEQERIDKKEQYLSIEEVCQLTRKTRASLNRWHNMGALKHNQIGLYKKSDVDKFMDKK